MFSVIPAEVRYDRHISDKAKLLYAEIAAATNTFGISEEDNKYFAQMMGVEPRTITRVLDDLIESGHVIRLFEHGRRKLRIVFKGLPMPESPDLEVVVREEDTQALTFLRHILTTWEHERNCTVADKESYLPLFKEKLKIYSEQEILSAVQGRLAFLHESAWHNNPVNHAIANDFNQWFSQEDAITRWTKQK